MDAVIETVKAVLVGVNVLLFLALATTLATAQSSKRDNAGDDAAAAAAAAAGAPPLVKRALLVTAHPDDESMFFLPLVHSLVSPAPQGEPEWELHLLCLSRGNFDGLGAVREQEMRVCGQFLGLQAAHIRVLEDAQLQDGLQVQWNRDHIAQIVLEYIDKHAVDAVFTFDDYGVSGHPNHIDVHFGVKWAVQEQHRRCGGEDAADGEQTATAAPPKKPVRGWALESVNLLRKYVGVLDALVAPSIFSRVGRDKSVFVFLFRPWWNHRAMALHGSQFVWYRRLFVAFSRYTFINTFKPLVEQPPEATPNASKKKTQ